MTVCVFELELQQTAAVIIIQKNWGHFTEVRIALHFCANTERLKRLGSRSRGKLMAKAGLEAGHPSSELSSLFARPRCLLWISNHPACCSGGLMKDFSLLMGFESWVIILTSYLRFSV